MNKAYIVRLATPEDEEGVMGLCELLAQENALLPVDKDLVRSLVRSILVDRQGFIGVIGDVGKLEAAIMLRVGTMWYSAHPVVEEFFSFVAPAYRVPGKTMQGLRTPGRADYLVEFAKSVSDKIGIPLLIGIVSNVRTEAKVRLYDRKLNKAGAFYLHQPNVAA